ncbi:RNA polymerase sigma factor [Actinomadura sp. BRA 177]|uniref:RNA polymerase sigma factor n=1 Tax=Actinomadura sp. BRA 177 TaxID=2745202 RepID=UPI001C3D0DF6|nr:RNA polymerase sigma factor [Actinomadura sp. BRA 177]
MTSDPNDAELIARSLDGDEDAFVEVVRRHEVAVGAYLARRVGRELAEDLLGEVWVAAFSSRASYDRSFPDARPWLFGVAHNMLRRHWRSRRDEDPLPDVTDLAPGWDRGPPSTTASPPSRCCGGRWRCSGRSSGRSSPWSPGRT